MDEHEIAEAIRETVFEFADPRFSDCSFDSALGEAAGFVLNFPHGVFLVTVVQIGE